MEGQFDAALDLLRRLSPHRIEANLAKVAQLVPHYTLDLLNTVDVPCKVRVCSKTGREFLTCDYNRDGDSYRSPWSNDYEPAMLDDNGEPHVGMKPSAGLRRLEQAANDAFDTYRNLYFDGGVSSVYFWDVDASNFAAAVLIKKASESGAEQTGCWDSIHVVEVERRGRQAVYRLTTSIMLQLDTSVEHLEKVNLSGSITRQTESTLTVMGEEDHLANIGRMVEESEIRMRSSLQEIYFGKTHEIVNEIRSAIPLGFLRQQAEWHREIADKVSRPQIPMVRPRESSPPAAEHSSATPCSQDAAITDSNCCSTDPSHLTTSTSCTSATHHQTDDIN